jgi:diacylglycerol kinase family enzyme
VVRILASAFSVETAWPQSPDHARLLAAQAVEAGYEVVAAMGGDGVAHHVGDALAGSPTALALIPTGTTNVYARLLGVPPRPAAAARLLVGPHRTSLLPLLQVEGSSAQSPVRRLALFAAGFGFDADVVRAAEAEPYHKYWFGGVHYARTAISTLIRDYRKRSASTKVRIDGQTVESLATLIQFHPFYTFFGPGRLRLGSFEPGTMTVLTAEALPARRIPSIATTLLRGGDLARIPGLQVWNGIEELHVEATPPITGQADGELTGPWSEARARLWPGAIRVIGPESSA